MYMSVIVEALKSIFLKLRSLWHNLPDERKKHIRDKVWSIMQAHFERKFEEHSAAKSKEHDKGAAA